MTPLQQLDVMERSSLYINPNILIYTLSVVAKVCLTGSFMLAVLNTVQE